MKEEQKNGTSKTHQHFLEWKNFKDINTNSYQLKASQTFINISIGRYLDRTKNNRKFLRQQKHAKVPIGSVTKKFQKMFFL